MRRVASPQGLTADPAHNPLSSAGVGAAILADLTVSVPSEKEARIERQALAQMASDDPAIKQGALDLAGEAGGAPIDSPVD